jgi:DNA-binding NarL/FixJ family response regulator
MHNGLKAVLFGGGIERIEQAANEREFRSKIVLNPYDLIVFDPLSGPGYSIQIAESLLEDFREKKFLMISEVDNYQNTVRLLEKGVNGFLTRECDEDEIKHAVFSISKGEKFYCNKVLDIILNKQHEVDNCEPTVLSERENEIAALVAGGKTNKEIAQLLHLSHHTVHTHRKNILKKLGINSASELAIYALKVGLIPA